MRVVNFSVLFFFFSFTSLAADVITLSGTITGVPPYVKSILYLDRFEGLDFVTADSVFITKDGTYKLNDLKGVPGLYRLSLGRESFIELMLSASDRSASFTATYDQLSNAILYLSNSKENTAYVEYQQLAFEADSQRQEMLQVTAMLPAFDPKSRTRLLQFEQQQENINAAFNNKMDQLAVAYRGTFTAEVLCRASKYPVMKNNAAAEGFDNYPAFLHHHYWDAVDFQDQRLLRHPLLSERVIDFLFAYCDKSERGLFDGAEIILDKPADAQLSNMLYSHELSLFYRKKLFNAIEKIGVKYHAGKTVTTIDAELAKLLTTVLTLQPGKPVPELMLPDKSKHSISLQAVAASNNLTLLIFWSSGCGGCEEEFEQLGQYYPALKNKKLAVYAASIDRELSIWEEALRSVSADYFHVSANEPLAELKLTNDFNIRHTPTTFLIDSKGMIVAKDLHGAQLKEAIEKQLAGY